MLFDTGDELNNGKTLSRDVIKMNGCVDNYLTDLPFIEHVSKEVGGFDQGSDNAFGLYCESHGLISYKNWTNVKKQKIKDDNWSAVPTTAFSLFDIMQNLTSDLWYKLCKKKENAILAGKIKEFSGVSKIDSTNKKWIMLWKFKATATRQ